MTPRSRRPPGSSWPARKIPPPCEWLFFSHFCDMGLSCVTDQHKPRGSELPVGPVQNMYPSLTWNDSHYRDSGISYNRENGPSLSLRKSDNSNGWFTSIIVTGIVVVISLTTHATALITRKVRGMGNLHPSHPHPRHRSRKHACVRSRSRSRDLMCTK